MNTITDTSTPVQLRTGVAADAAAIHALITANLSAGHLLPRTFEDVEEHAHRFVVAVSGDAVIGCGELAPLSAEVAEVRSLVVDEACRGQRTGVVGLVIVVNFGAPPPRFESPLPAAAGLRRSPAP